MRIATQHPYLPAHEKADPVPVRTRHLSLHRVPDHGLRVQGVAEPNVGPALVDAPAGHDEVRGEGEDAGGVGEGRGRGRGVGGEDGGRDGGVERDVAGDGEDAEVLECQGKAL